MLFSITLSSELSGDGSESEASFVILNPGDDETTNNEIHTDQDILETVTPDSEDVNKQQHSLENEILEAIRQAGLDDMYWIKKILNEFKVESLDKLKNVTEQQVRDFLESIHDPVQTHLHRVFAKLVGIDISRTETKGSKASSVKSVPLSDSSSEKEGTRQKYPEEFQDHKELEFRSTPEEDEKKKSKCEEEKQMYSFREDIQQWIKEYSCSNLEQIAEEIRRLEKIRLKYDNIEEHWAKEVLYLRKVQSALMQTAEFIMEDDRQIQHLRDETSDEREQIRKMIASLLRCVLNVEGRLQEDRFPNLRLITETIEEIEGNREVEAFQIQTTEQLLEVWKGYKTDSNMNEETSLILMQLRLESTMKSMEQGPKKTFEYLLFIGLLQTFGFDTSMFKFGYQLSKHDMDNIFQRFEAHLNEFKTLHTEIEMQAYLFKLAMHNLKNKEKSVLHMAKSLAERLDKNLRQFCLEDNINLAKLHQKVETILPDNFQLDMESIAYSFQSHFQFLTKSQNEYVEQQQDDCSSNIKAAKSLLLLEERIIEAMGMRKYYPQKLSLEEVITLSSTIPDDVYKKPTTLLELPWYFIKHIIGLDSDTRESCNVLGSEDDSSDSDEEEKLKIKKKGETIECLHPLDLQKIVMLCADDFLRQELIDKMVRCQYAVPFILPVTHNSTSKKLILLWSMKSLVRTYYHGDQDVTKQLVDLETPLMTFMNVGMETSWKSKLLNKMLSQQQETFWHQALEGGSIAPKLSEGMIEVAWWLPGRLGDNKFSCPVTFANVRGDASNSEGTCCNLIPVSSMTFVFVEGIDATLKAFLQKQRSLKRVIMIVLHKKQTGIKEKVKNLREEFHLDKNQIICREEHDKNFNSIHQQIKASVDNVISADKGTISL